MEIIGFVVMFIILGKVSLAYLVVMANNLGQYNIGGVPNSKTVKVFTLVFMVVIMFVWYQLFKHAPFHFSMD